MSLFQTATVACPSCATPVDFEAVVSVNADRRPDLRDAILKGSFQREACAKCGHVFRMEPEMTLLDVRRKQWILVQPIAELPRWIELENHAVDLFDDAFGPRTPRTVQMLARGITPRVTFGWGAFREKLLCADHQIDDVNLELTKTAIVRGLDSPPLADDTELRLVAVEGDELVLAWIEAALERLVESLRTPRALYDEIAADKDGWAPLREQLSAGPFVDLHRLLIKAA